MSSLNNRRRSTSLRSFIPLILASAVAALSLLALIASGCGGSGSAQTGSLDAGTGPATTKNKGPITQDLVQNLIKRKLGDAGVQGQPVIRTVTLTPESGGVTVNMELNRTASCHPGALVGTAVTMAQQVMSAEFLYPDVQKAQLILYGPSEDPKDKDKPAVRIVVTKDAAAKIDWFQFNEQTVAGLVSDYWVEPSVYANYQQYGSAPITDQEKLQAANSTKTTP